MLADLDSMKDKSVFDPTQVNFFDNQSAILSVLLRHSVEFVLPSLYGPDVTGEMRVIGVDTKKLTKTKEVLMVKFVTPQYLKDSAMQMYCMH